MANYERRSSDKDEMHVFDGGEDDEESEGSRASAPNSSPMSRLA